MQERISKLVKEFNGAVKYAPMLADHPDWTDEECTAFAKKWHKVAVEQLGKALDWTNAHWHNPPEGKQAWNHGIPYCRNLPTNSMILQAAKQ